MQTISSNFNVRGHHDHPFIIAVSSSATIRRYTIVTKSTRNSPSWAFAGCSASLIVQPHPCECLTLRGAWVVTLFLEIQCGIFCSEKIRNRLSDPGWISRRPQKKKKRTWSFYLVKPEIWNYVFIVDLLTTIVARRHGFLQLLHPLHNASADSQLHNCTITC